MKTPAQLHAITKEALAAHSKGDLAETKRILNKLTTPEMAVVIKALSKVLTIGSRR